MQVETVALDIVALAALPNDSAKADSTGIDGDLARRQRRRRSRTS